MTALVVLMTVLPLVMGVLNVTPDSFSDGGRFADPQAAIAHGRQLRAEGADIVDVGGESTRPGAAPLGIAEELARVVPVVEVLAAEGRVSIDTRHAEVAEAALLAGASIVNDISASLYEVAAAHGAGWVAMHMQGLPESMQNSPSYQDVVSEVRDLLLAAAEQGRSAGVNEIWIDPGIGFGKTDTHNLALLGALPELVATGWPVAVGTSRKGFLARLLGASDGVDRTAPDDRIEGSLATATWAFASGVAMVRAHDVKATAESAAIVAA